MRHEVISIVGGGWSVRDIDLDRIPGAIVAVNDSAMYLPRCDFIVSMDRMWTENRWPRLREMRRNTHLRRSAMQNILGQKWPWLSVFECDHESMEFTDQAGVLNGTNSGMCAFNLAYQLRPKTIVLFGFDMCRNAKGEAYWYEPYPWAPGKTTTGKYAKWSAQFEAAKRSCARANIEVFNASPTSAIKTFRKTKEFLKTESVACAS